MVDDFDNNKVNNSQVEHQRQIRTHRKGKFVYFPSFCPVSSPSNNCSCLPQLLRCWPHLQADWSAWGRHAGWRCRLGAGDLMDETDKSKKKGEFFSLFFYPISFPSNYWSSSLVDYVTDRRRWQRQSQRWLNWTSMTQTNSGHTEKVSSRVLLLVFSASYLSNLWSSSPRLRCRLSHLWEEHPTPGRRAGRCRHPRAGDLTCTVVGGNRVQQATQGAAPVTAGGGVWADWRHLHQRTKVEAQCSFVYALGGGQWKITHHQLSQMPEEVVHNNS